MSRGLLPRKFSADDKVVPTRVNRYAFRTRAVTAFATYGKKELAQMPNIGVPDTQTNLIQTYFSYLPPNSRPETLWPISSLTRLDGFFMYIYIYISILFKRFFVISHREKVYLIHTLLHDLCIRHTCYIALVVFPPYSNLSDILSCVIAKKSSWYLGFRQPSEFRSEDTFEYVCFFTELSIIVGKSSVKIQFFENYERNVKKMRQSRNYFFLIFRIFHYYSLIMNIYIFLNS